MCISLTSACPEDGDGNGEGEGDGEGGKELEEGKDEEGNEGEREGRDEVKGEGEEMVDGGEGNKDKGKYWEEEDWWEEGSKDKLSGYAG
mmetsp:Transcript_11484/g.15657  ORF Transcript_11484/g.15657 Transcript_11484/m.15657 type:complete len:89 (-) Transcript_11484:184-450(-)